jgi:hypothetical protein
MPDLLGNVPGGFGPTDSGLLCGERYECAVCVIYHDVFDNRASFPAPPRSGFHEYIANDITLAIS